MVRSRFWPQLPRPVKTCSTAEGRPLIQNLQ